jgi:hypothetical protein
VCAIPKEMSLQNIFEKFEKGKFFGRESKVKVNFLFQ